MATGDGGGFTGLGSTAADIARDLYTTLSMRLAERTAAAEPMYPQIATVVESTSKSQRFDFSKALAEVREYAGEFVFNKIKLYDYELTNRDWGTGLEWKRDDLEDDQIGALQLGIDEYINAMLEHPDSHFVTFLNHQIAGTTSEFGTGFDGKVVFSATHTWGTNVPYVTDQSNLLTGSNTGKLDLTYGQANLQTAYDKLSNGFFWPHSDGVGGRIVNTPTHLLCSGSVYWDAKRILNSTEVQSGSTSTLGLPNKNVLQDMNLQIVRMPGLTAGYWIMADLSKPTRFAIFQRRKQIEQSFIGPGSETWENNRIARALAFARYAIGQGFWFRAIAGDGT